MRVIIPPVASWFRSARAQQATIAAVLALCFGLALTSSARAQNLDVCQPPADRGDGTEADPSEFEGCDRGSYFLSVERRKNGDIGPTATSFEMRLPNTPGCDPVDVAGTMGFGDGSSDIPVAADGSFHFEGPTGYVSPDDHVTFDGTFHTNGTTASGTLRYEFLDGSGVCAPPPRTVNFTLGCVSSCQRGRAAPTEDNRNPIARPDTKYVDFKHYNDLRLPKPRTAKVFVLTNDSDPDGDQLSVSAVSIIGGKVFTRSKKPAQVYSSGTEVFFKPPSGDYVGIVNLGYSISDGHGGSASSTIRIEYRVCEAESVRMSTAPASNSRKGKPVEERAEHKVRWCTNGDSAKVTSSKVTLESTTLGKIKKLAGLSVLKGIFSTSFRNNGGKIGGSKVSGTGITEMCFTPGGKLVTALGTKLGKKLALAAVPKLVTIFLSAGYKKKAAQAAVKKMLDDVVFKRVKKVACFKYGGWSPRWSWSFKPIGDLTVSWFADQALPGREVIIRFRPYVMKGQYSGGKFRHRCVRYKDATGLTEHWYASDCTHPPPPKYLN